MDLTDPWHKHVWQTIKRLTHKLRAAQEAERGYSIFDVLAIQATEPHTKQEFLRREQFYDILLYVGDMLGIAPKDLPAHLFRHIEANLDVQNPCRASDLEGVLLRIFGLK